ncbi:MAG: hypothetical protein K0R03_1699 [Moraxellaceae bacterium]|jgi:uncharacterized membrane protein YqiK|nr:hypothetical protein [Moraxellaceae bacterium]
MEMVFLTSGIVAVFLFGIFIMFAKFYHKVEQGYAMIVNTLRSEPDVTFTGRMVYPIIHIKELMDISLKTIEIDRSGKEGLICKDNIRADIKVKFFVRVNKTTEDVLRVAQAIGCARASSQETLEELFSAKFSEALKTVGKAMDFVELYQARDRFRDEIIRQIGDDLSGYALEDAAIDFLEQTPLEKLDLNNILDAQGIKKITELTAVEHVRTNELRRDEEMQIKKKDVETQETLLELERQQAEATARQAREVASVQAREQAEAQKIEAEERAKAEVARLLSEQQIAVQNENMLREKEVAENNRKRAVAIEEEKVTRARQLEIVDREREVTLQEIEKDKAVEVQKKAIADVIRERVIVERTVAEQEEAIKEVRVVSEADRTRKSVVIAAEAQAEEKLTIDVKAAEAAERAARHKAAQELTLAEAMLKVAEKEAEAKKREAEGVEAITAAPGLAHARVKMVDADALQKYGSAEAEALRLKLEAEAVGKEKLGLADVNVRTADADAMVKQGHAEAEAVQARFEAEARGLREKFGAMKEMSPETRAHEELRLRLNNDHVETLKMIDAQSSIATEQAELLGKALANAKIDIVGGEGDYFERFARALAVGKGIDGAIHKSTTLQTALRDHLSGDRDMVGDFKELVGALGGASGEISNLSMANFLQRVMKEGSDEQKKSLRSLIDGFGK